MDKTIIGLLSAASALALVGGAQASAASPLDGANLMQPARSFTELLDPIPNAQSILQAENERSADAAAQEKPVVLAQYYYHHHHHHHYYRHHHHHYYYYHHHYYRHHHHHHHYYDYY